MESEGRYDLIVALSPHSEEVSQEIAYPERFREVRSGDESFRELSMALLNRNHLSPGIPPEVPAAHLVVESIVQPTYGCALLHFGLRRLRKHQAIVVKLARTHPSLVTGKQGRLTGKSCGRSLCVLLQTMPVSDRWRER